MAPWLAFERYEVGFAVPPLLAALPLWGEGATEREGDTLVGTFWGPVSSACLFILPLSFILPMLFTRVFYSRGDAERLVDSPGDEQFDEDIYIYIHIDYALFGVFRTVEVQRQIFSGR